jgi:hypothetical protein
MSQTPDAPFTGSTITLADISTRFGVSKTIAWRMVQQVGMKPVNVGEPTQADRYDASEIYKLRAIALNRRKTR